MIAQLLSVTQPYFLILAVKKLMVKVSTHSLRSQRDTERKLFFADAECVQSGRLMKMDCWRRKTTSAGDWRGDARVDFVSIISAA